MSHNRELATAMALVRRICAEVAFIPGTTDIGLDDDLLRLRSRRVVLEGYSHTNNPNKGLGVVHHGAVSNCTSLYCGGHVASRNESTLDCVKILLLSLSGASIESQIRLNRTNFFWDRGYGGIEGDVNSFAMAKGAVLVGTSRRMKSFPFTFDQRPGTSRRLIQEKGTMAAYWAVKGTGRQTQYALAHRSGMGRVVLMHTTDEALGPGRYTLITRDGKNATIKYARDDDVVIPYLLQSSSPPGVIMLTESQRTPEWFLLRKFRITGTGAYGIWKFISSSMNDDLLDENMNAVIQILSMRSNDNNLVEPLEEDNQSYEREALNTLLLPDLRRICRNKKLPVSGSKGILIDRILSWTSQQDEASRRPAAQNSILSILMKSWFMAPFKSRACREGTLNEPFIFANFPRFVSQKSAKEGPDGQRRTVVESIHEFGLMCNADDTNAAFSPDAIAGIADVLPDGTSTSVVALVEMKSKCSQATLSAEMELITLYGEYQEINAEEDPISFKSSIPDTSYRCQLLHGMASGNLDNAFFVVASLRKIIRVVRVRISSQIRGQYMSAIAHLGRQHLRWIVDGGVVPEMEFETGSHAVDQHSVQTTFDLWQAMCNLIIDERGRPLPAGKHLLPEVVATWNRGKGPIDVYSRFQKNIKSVHSRLGPVAAIWMRLVMTTVYNAYHSFNLSRAAAFLASNECKSFKDFQRIRARQCSFRQFCQLLANDLTVEVASELNYTASSSEDEEAMPNDEASVQEVILYNKREAFFSRPKLISKRRSRRLVHVPCSAGKQSSCVWCCRLDHSPGFQKHSRHGRKTTWLCSTCDVPLCKVNRYSGRSCFDLFHEADSLFDPCCEEAQEAVHVRAHTNRTLPPSRRRVTTASSGHADISAATSCNEDAAFCDSEEEEMAIPENSSSDDADKNAKHPAIRRRTATKAIAIPRRRTRQSYFI